MYQFIEKGINKTREGTLRWYEEQFSAVPLPEEVCVQTDVPYLDDGENCHKMDIYVPRNHTKKLPVVFNFHGGGLVSCDRRFNKLFCSELAKQGVLVFCIDYPLVPQSDVYRILRDTYQGICRAYQLLDQWNGDKQRLFLCGDSSGGFISTYLAALHNNHLIAESLGITPLDFRISGLSTISGMFYSSKIDKNGIFLLRKEFYGKSYRKHPFWGYVNPENTSVLQSLPQTLCITSTGDFLRKNTLKFVSAMKKAGKDVILEDFSNKKLVHDFVCLMPNAKETTEAIDLLSKFFLAE